MKGPIQSVEATCLIHATEDSGKVEAALLELLGTREKPDLVRLEGHFGNEILRARLHLTGEEAQKAFETLVGRIPESVRQELLGDLPSLIDEHSALFLRFDKQSLVSGSVVMGSSDAVRVKVKPRAFMMRGGVSRFFEGLLGGR